MIRSSETTYKLETNIFNGDAIVQLSLNVASIYPGILKGGGVFSPTWLAAPTYRVWCRADREEADQSPTNFVYDLKLAPDVVIKQLIQTNGENSWG
ncbi:MAG: hypothetical protein WDM76_01400 [Limisphaerales bacterium]